MGVGNGATSCSHIDVATSFDQLDERYSSAFVSAHKTPDTYGRSVSPSRKAGITRNYYILYLQEHNRVLQR